MCTPMAWSCGSCSRLRHPLKASATCGRCVRACARAGGWVLSWQLGMGVGGPPGGPSQRRLQAAGHTHCGRPGRTAKQVEAGRAPAIATGLRLSASGCGARAGCSEARGAGEGALAAVAVLPSRRYQEGRAKACCICTLSRTPGRACSLARVHSPYSQLLLGEAEPLPCGLASQLAK